MSRTTKKIGQQSGRQRWRCNACGKKFQDTRRVKRRTQAKLASDYLWGKQTLDQLHDQTGRSVSWIRQQLTAYDSPPRTLTPRPVVVTADAFYFHRGNGMMVFRSQALRENLLWFRVAYETTGDYVRGLDRLKQAGWVIQALVMDGRKGVREAVEHRFPVQMCHFHQVQIVTRYLTMSPQLEAAKQLAALTATLTTSTETEFTARLTRWYERWSVTVTERTISEERTRSGRRRWWYTHRRLRSAYRSLATNVPYLFTFERHPELTIPTTTNSLDGSVSHWRGKLGVHRGLKLTRRIKLTEALLKGKDPKN